MINIPELCHTNHKLIMPIIITSFWFNLVNAGLKNTFLDDLMTANKELDEIVDFSIQIEAITDEENLPPSQSREHNDYTFQNKGLFRVDCTLPEYNLPTPNAENIGTYGKQRLKKFFNDEYNHRFLIHSMHEKLKTFRKDMTDLDLFPISFENLEKVISDLYESVDEEYAPYDALKDSATSVNSESTHSLSSSNPIETDISQKQINHIKCAFVRLKKKFTTRCQYENYLYLTPQPKVLIGAPSKKDELAVFLSELNDEKRSQLPKLKPLTSCSIEELNAPYFYREEERKLSCIEKTLNTSFTIFCSFWYTRKTQERSVGKDKND